MSLILTQGARKKSNQGNWTTDSYTVVVLSGSGGLGRPYCVEQSHCVFMYRTTVCPELIAGSILETVREGKRTINFFNINFLPPTQNAPFWAPRKKFMCLISWEKTQTRDPHKLFRGGFLGQKGVPNGPFSATKSLVYCSFPGLKRRAQ